MLSRLLTVIEAHLFVLVVSAGPPLFALGLWTVTVSRDVHETLGIALCGLALLFALWMLCHAMASPHVRNQVCQSGRLRPVWTGLQVCWLVAWITASLPFLLFGFVLAAVGLLFGPAPSWNHVR